MSVRLPTANDRAFRYALAREAYRRRTIRVIDRDLRGFDLLVSSKQGLFAADRAGVKPVLWGLFFGITRHEDAVYLFEACDSGASPALMSRIVRFRIRQGELRDEAILVEGLDNRCHQIAVIDGLLCVVDTTNQAILRFRLDGARVDAKRPIPFGPGEDGSVGEYRHLNSIAEVGDRIALVLHNGPVEEPSELAWVDRDWRLLERLRLPGYQCHDILALPDGSVWHCGSRAGELVNANGARISVSDRMTRGLVTVGDGLAVGTSVFGPRALRETLVGSIIYLDRAFGRVAEVGSPGAPTDLLAL